MQENYKLTAENVVKGFCAEELRALIGKRNKEFEKYAETNCNDKKFGCHHNHGHNDEDQN